VAGNAKTLKKTIFFLTTHNDLPLNVCAGRGEPGLRGRSVTIFRPYHRHLRRVFAEGSVQSSAMRLEFWNEIFVDSFVYWRRNDGPKEAQ
jgi:hypothetical protein